MNKKLLYFIGIAAFLCALYSLPVPDGLTADGYVSILIMIATVLFWVLEIFPIAFSAVLFTLLPAVLNIVPLAAMMNNFATPTLFFVFAMFIMSAAFYNSGLSRRIVLWASMKSKGKPDKLLLYIMLASGLLSCFFADVPVMAMMVPIAIVILQNNNCKAGESSFGKAMMIGLPFACLIGGVGTPAGSAVNIMTMNTLNDMAQIDISFLEWTCLGIPLACILIPVSWFVIVKVYPPEMEFLAGMETVRREYESLKALSANEIKFLLIFAFNIVFWMTDKIHHIPLPVACVLGTSLLLMPGMKLIDWSRDGRKIGWEIIVVTGAANALGVLLWEQGSASWIAAVCLNGIAGLPLWLLIAVISAFTVAVHLLIPVNFAIIAVMLPALVAFAHGVGINPALLAIPMGFSVSAALLLPLDTVSLVSYDSGYYEMKDMFKPGIFVSLVWITVVPCIMLTIGKLLHLL